MENSIEFFLNTHFEWSLSCQDLVITVCYESPKQEKVSYAFEHLVQNLKAYNGVRI